ncbi:AraC family transcriptional regulator [Vibrio mangrovi]|uniref:AraC family transcriptional regulator n=1 Tax=Vibrio mangrovi TaxID=474394 RepID=A0A1Y6IMW3_9VIBR|nr:AraC family transcriptional regulator [Vibrio mangrovi]MDW6004215.1 AraC family transcriptional regulator [Vibrio mangrovi]SMR98987.1 HTH-type transcriptional activator RhaS [Vibrio mangrovi]
MNDWIEKIRSQVEKYMVLGESVTLFSGVSVFASTGTTCPVSTLHEPMLCLVLQGAKEAIIGQNVLRYEMASFFVNSVELPIASRIIEASEHQPYIAINMTLDTDKLADIVTRFPGTLHQQEGNCYAVTPATETLLEPLWRLMTLLDIPDDIPFLFPMIDREILYRLLQGSQQSILRQIAGTDNRVMKVRQAIRWIRTHYARAIPIHVLAEESGMSLSSLHRHFRAATGMTPLQYQKTLRLQEARQLLVGGADVGDTAYKVGYESPSHFSREYTRMFGITPSVDAKQLRGRGVTPAEISHAPW